MYVHIPPPSPKEKLLIYYSKLMLDSQESSMEISHLYMDIGEITPVERYTFYIILCRKSLRGRINI